MPRHRPPFKLSGRRWWKTWTVLAAAILLVAVAVRALPAVRGSLPTGKAQWIWRAMDRKDNYPTVFYAVRDFELASAPSRARLLITADEEYVVTLNGRPIAAGMYFRRNSGTTLDAYEVGPLLRAGGNRLVVELRSGRGAGGLLAALEGEAGEPILVSDESWRIVRKHELGLLRGWLPIDPSGGDTSEPAFCWGNPPLGRWGRPRVGPAEPLLPRAPLVPAASARPLALSLGGHEVGRPPGAPMLYDWGREVEGYLTLDVPPSKDPGTGLLFTGAAEPPDPLRAPYTAPVLVLPGRHDWMDAQPRRFRYAVVVGLARSGRPATASVLPAPAHPMSRDPEEMKVFGVEGPRLRTPVEDEVWSKLQRLAGIARREEL